MSALSRRSVLGAGLACAPLISCATASPSARPAARAAGGLTRLNLNGVFDASNALKPGIQTIAGGKRPTRVFVPRSPPPAAGYPAALALHGATQNAKIVIRGFEQTCEALGVVLVAPNSAQATWDLENGPYGVDAANIEAAMNAAMVRVPIDRTRLACTGFSDGASYALSLGLNEGELFTDILAYSPGFSRPDARVGKPHLFIAHGYVDVILPFDGSHGIADALAAQGYDVQFYPFVGGHTPESGAVATGFRRFVGRGGRA